MSGTFSGLWSVWNLCLRVCGFRFYIFFFWCVWTFLKFRECRTYTWGFIDYEFETPYLVNFQVSEVWNLSQRLWSPSLEPSPDILKSLEWGTFEGFLEHYVWKFLKSVKYGTFVQWSLSLEPSLGVSRLFSMGLFSRGPWWDTCVRTFIESKLKTLCPGVSSVTEV